MLPAVALIVSVTTMEVWLPEAVTNRQTDARQSDPYKLLW